MNKILKVATAALTVALLSTSTVSYSGSTSHIAILDAYNDAYDVGGIIIRSTQDDYTILTTLQLPNDKAKLCGTFGTLVDEIVVTLDDHTTVDVVCD